MTDSPADIYQRHLDAMTDAVWARDAEAIAALIDAEVDVVTGGHPGPSVTRDAAVATYLSFRQAMQGVGATSYHRICTNAAVAAPDELDGTHVTYIMRGGNYVIDPYACDQTLRRHGAVWLMAGIRCERHHLGGASFGGGPSRIRGPQPEARTPDPERTIP